MHQIVPEPGSNPRRTDEIPGFDSPLIRAIALRATPDGFEHRRCQRCGSRSLLEVNAKGPHYLAYRCADCGRHVGYHRTPTIVKRARRFVLKFGKFEEKTLGELSRSARGRNYLEWLVRIVGGEVGYAAQLVLESCNP